MPADFNVAVRVMLIDQASRKLAQIAGSFGGAERMAARLQLGLRNIEATRGLSIRKAELAARLDRDGLAALNAKYSNLLTLGDLEDTQAQRRQLNAQIIAAEQRASIRRQEEQLRLQRLSNDATEKRALLMRAGMAARGERMAAGLGAVGGVAAIGAGITLGTFELAKRGLPITALQSQLQIAGGLNKAQVATLTQRTLGLSQQLGVVDWQTEMKIALALYQTTSAKLAARTLAPVSYGAELAKLMNRGPLVESAGEFARIGNILGVTSARQSLTASTAVANVLRSGGHGFTMGELARWSTFVAPVLPGNTVTGRATQLEQFGLLAGRYGALQGAFSGESVRNLIRQVTVSKSGKDVALVQTLQRYGLARKPDERTFTNIVEAIRRAEKAQQGAPLKTFNLLLGSAAEVAMAQQIARIPRSGLQSIENAPKHNLTILQMWKTQMQSANARVEQMSARMATLGQVIGYDMNGPLKTFSTYVGDLASKLTMFAKVHPQGFRLLAQDVGMLMEIMLRTAAVMAKVAGPGTTAALQIMNSVLRADLGAVKGLQHPGTAAAGLGRSLITPGVDTLKWIAKETGLVQATGPINIHVTGGADPHKTADAVLKKLKDGVHQSAMSASSHTSPTASPHLYGPPRR